MTRSCLLAIVALLTLGVYSANAADDPVFSGPQVGEILPPLMAKGVFGDAADEELNLIEKGDADPVALIFVHARTRPAFGLTNAIMKWAVKRDKLNCGVVFLTDDSTATSEWMRKIRTHFAEGVAYTVSSDGAEGPGSYGLNRNVTLTVLVGTEGKVTANFALVQPSMQADGPKIIKAIVDVTGGGKVPTLDEIGGARYARDRNMRAMQQNGRGEQNDPRLMSLVRAVINKQATKEEVAEAVTKVDEYIAKRPPAQRQIGQIASRIVNSDKLGNYGTEAAQETIRQWAKKYGPSRDGGRNKVETDDTNR